MFSFLILFLFLVLDDFIIIVYLNEAFSIFSSLIIFTLQIQKNTWKHMKIHAFLNWSFSNKLPIGFLLSDDAYAFKMLFTFASVVLIKQIFLRNRCSQPKLDNLTKLKFSTRWLSGGQSNLMSFLIIPKFPETISCCCWTFYVRVVNSC